MMIKRTLDSLLIAANYVVISSIYLILLSVSYTHSSAQVMPVKAQALIDRSLTTLDMSRRDMAMRHDAVEVDPFRLQVVKDAFDNPLSSLDALYTYTPALSAFGKEQVTWIFKQAFDDLDIGQYEENPLTLTSPFKSYVVSVKNISGDTLPTKILDSPLYTSLVARFIEPLMKSVEQLNIERANLLSDKLLKEQCDSLLMMSSDDENSDVYQLKANELKSDSILRQYFKRSARYDIRPIMNISASLYSKLAFELLTVIKTKKEYSDLAETIIIETKLGKIAIGGIGADTYTSDYLMIIDVGGNDRYFSTQSKDKSLNLSAHVIIDLDGSDLYSHGDYSLAHGFFGCSYLIDCSGNDVYNAGSFSLGSGLYGIGILHDMSGTDSYKGGVFSQGAGSFGIGMLIDDSGNDSYNVQANGQAFAGTKGLGILCDKSGNDVFATVSPFVDVLRYDAHYVTFTQGATIGSRPIASAGIALLYDKSGNDTYLSDIYGQGTAYWFGIAGLIDEAGEDKYLSYQYAQGAGIHFAHAFLWDTKGDDVYVSHGVSQGCGHDVGFGLLLDETGNDNYTVESLSLGGGNANSVSIFCDVEGDDAYIARNTSNTMGFSDFRRSYGMIGIFADGNGKDTYNESSKNNRTATKSTFGVFLDISPQSESADNTVAEQTESKPELVLGSTLQQMFVQASTAPQKYQYMVKPARDEIVRRNKESLEYLKQFLGTEYPRERLAMEDIMPRLYKFDSVAVSQLVVDSLSSKKTSTILFSLWLAGKCSVTVAEPKLELLLKHEDWRIRAATAQQIGEGNFVKLAPVCARLLSDDIPNVRARAAYTVASLLPIESVSLCRNSMKDLSQLVRNSIAMGLKKSNAITPELMTNYIKTYKTTRGLKSIMRVVTSMDSTKDISGVMQMISECKTDVREMAYRAMLENSTPFWINQFKLLADQDREIDVLMLRRSYSTVNDTAHSYQPKQQPASEQQLQQPVSTPKSKKQ
jgi:hypothetical protein